MSKERAKGLGYVEGLNPLEYEAAKLRAAVDQKITEIIGVLQESRFKPNTGSIRGDLLLASHKINWSLARLHEISMLQWVMQHPGIKILSPRTQHEQKEKPRTETEGAQQDNLHDGG